MRTTVIPAQITTVEDKIAGSLNLTQIVLLMIPVIWAATLYTVFPPQFQLIWYKLPFFFLISAICLILALRIKGKVVLNWLMVVLKYNIRPKYYLFNKNDISLRDIYLPEYEKKPSKLSVLFTKLAKSEKNQGIKIPAKSFGIEDLMKLKDFLHNPNYSLSLKPDNKGGLYVALEQIKR